MFCFLMNDFKQVSRNLLKAKAKISWEYAVTTNRTYGEHQNEFQVWKEQLGTFTWDPQRITVLTLLTRTTKSSIPHMVDDSSALKPQPKHLYIKKKKIQVIVLLKHTIKIWLMVLSQLVSV